MIFLMLTSDAVFRNGTAHRDTKMKVMESKVGDRDMVTGPRVRRLAEIDTACARSRLVFGLPRPDDHSNVASLAEKRAERKEHDRVRPGPIKPAE
jgi:hypothetical protein